MQTLRRSYHPRFNPRTLRQWCIVCSSSNWTDPNTARLMVIESREWFVKKIIRQNLTNFFDKFTNRIFDNLMVNFLVNFRVKFLVIFFLVNFWQILDEIFDLNFWPKFLTHYKVDNLFFWWINFDELILTNLF